MCLPPPTPELYSYIVRKQIPHTPHCLLPHLSLLSPQSGAIGEFKVTCDALNPGSSAPRSIACDAPQSASARCPRDERDSEVPGRTRRFRHGSMVRTRASRSDNISSVNAANLMQPSVRSALRATISDQCQRDCGLCPLHVLCSSTWLGPSPSECLLRLGGGIYVSRSGPHAAIVGPHAATRS